MKARTAILVALLACGLGLAIGEELKADQQPASGTVPGTAVKATWEYRVVVEPTPATGAALAGAGADGWELVAVVSQERYSGNARQTEVYYYLKRPAVRSGK